MLARKMVWPGVSMILLGIILSLNNNEAQEIKAYQSTNTINSDLPFVTVRDAVNMENEAEATFVIELSHPANEEVSVFYTTVPGTAEVDQDFAFDNGYLTIPMGQRSMTITVPLLPDSVMNEDDENFYLELANSEGAVLSKNQYQATIVEDDLDLEIWSLGEAGFNGAMLGMAVDSVGDIYVITNYSSFLANWIAKYDADGNPIWVNNFGLRAGEIAIDQDDNIYLAGEKDENYHLVKINPDGDVQWERSYDGPDSLYDSIMGVAFDQEGNIFVTGHSRSALPGDPWGIVDVAVLKYDFLGNLLWQQRYHSSDNSLYDYGYFIAVDAAGHAYVVGESAMAGGGMPTLILKFSPEGVMEWEKSIYALDGGAFASNIVSEIALDTQGFLYIAGGSREFIGGFPNNYRYQGYLMKVSPLGERVWGRPCLNSQSETLSYASSIAFDKRGAVLLGCSQDHQMLTIKYAPDGSTIWKSFISGTNNDLIVDEHGDSYAVGFTNGNAVILQYNAEGKLRWQYVVPDTDDSWISYIRQGLDGELFVGGQVDGEFFLGRFTPPPIPSLLSIYSSFVLPEAGDVAPMNFTVSLAAPRAEDVAVHYETVDGTARAGSDYTPISGTLMIPAQQTTAVLTVSILPGAADAGNPFFFLNLSNAVYTNLSVSQATGAIWDSVLFLPFVPKRP